MNLGNKEVRFAVEETTARLFKARCAEQGRSMTSVLKPAMEEFLRTTPPRFKRPQVD